MKDMKNHNDLVDIAKMRNAYNQIPGPLQRQILLRLCSGFILLFLTICMLCARTAAASTLTCITISVFSVASATRLFIRAASGSYVIISGMCVSVAMTSIRKRTKMITLQTNDGMILQINIKQRLKKTKPGSSIVLYVASNTSVYEKEGVHLLHSYLAIVMDSNINE